MQQQPYGALFPDSGEPTLVLSFPRKTGRIPKGNYAFIEMYCTDEDCDCRRVTLLVVNDKMAMKAVINMDFDQDGEFSGPLLDSRYKQSAYAPELLEEYVAMLNTHPENLAMLHRHYRDVRVKIDGSPYDGTPVPAPENIPFTAQQADRPPANVEHAPEFLPARHPVKNRKTPAKDSLAGESGLAYFIECYRTSGDYDDFTRHSTLQQELRRYLLDTGTFPEEMATHLVALRASTDDRHFDAVLRLLFDVLEILRVDLERQRPRAKKIMERLQATLAEQVFIRCGDAEICTAVSHILLQSRIELHPVLLDANNQRLQAITQDMDDLEPSFDNALNELFDGIREMSGNSPYDALDNLLQVLALNPPEMQASLCGEMLTSDDPMIRDTSALMILHPVLEVRRGVAELLANNAAHITPETLRRLIVSRNWFPEEVRISIDATISAARRSRISCAPLPKSLPTKIYASPIDGAAAQSFQIIVPDGKKFKSCSILLKRGAGVADAFIIDLAGKRELKKFLALMDEEGAFIESSDDYLDQRICHALAEGAVLGKAPNHWLLQVAEYLGKDSWRAVAFNPDRELEAMHADLRTSDPMHLSPEAFSKALEDSADWCTEYAFANSWFEDDAEVDRVIETARAKKRTSKLAREINAINALLESILEKRRHCWLERLTLCALWLKSSINPPLPWHQMFHLAAAVANPDLKLSEIPLMENIAGYSLAAHRDRMAETASPY